MRCVQLHIATPLSVLIAGCLAMSISDAQARSAVQRDVEGYAIASCLTEQKEPYLSDQGDGWASAIVQRSHGGLEPFKAVTAAVEAELAKGHMAVIRDETQPMKGVTLPIAYCAEIIDVPSVHAAIEKAVKQLAQSYSGHGR
jgi:hypothetical protein